jgi:hypothetical protein
VISQIVFFHAPPSPKRDQAARLASMRFAYVANGSVERLVSPKD